MLRPLVITISLATMAAGGTPDLIVHHGKILTVDTQFSIAEAMAITGHKITAVSDNDSILKLKGAGTRLLDLKGRTVLPGLIDSHVHPGNASMTEYDHVIPPMETIADVLSYFQVRTKAVKEGEWIMLQQVFITRLKEQRYPTREELDLVAPKHPVVFRTGPDGAFNSLALKLCGIDRNYKIPEGTLGKVEKDATGEPTGILRTFRAYAKIPDSARIPSAPPEQRIERLAKLFRSYNEAGLTSICDRDNTREVADYFQALRERNQLTVRVSLSRGVSTLQPLTNVLADIRKAAQDRLYQERDDRLRIIGVKVYLDGGMLTGSAYMREPWGVSTLYAITDPAYRGTRFIQQPDLVAMMRAAAESGLQFTTHSVGDGAVHAMLDGYETVSQEITLKQTRPCISHANFMSGEAVQKMKALGVAVDIQPAWLYLDTRTLTQHFGYERMRWFQPLRSIAAAGGIAGGGSDHMQKIGLQRSVNPYNPFLGMATTITRRGKWYDGQLHPEEALSREQAIRFYTMNNAWILFQEEKTGSLEPGKLADFIIVDTDIMACPAEKIAETQVLQTYLDGQLVYSSSKDNF